MSDFAPATIDQEPDDEDVVDAPAFDKQSWLADGKSDLVEGELPVPGLGDSVKIRSLSAAHQAQIQDQCLRLRNDEMKVDSQRMKVLKFKRGVIEPAFEEEEVVRIARRFGKAFDFVVSMIDEISTATEEDVAKAKARFRPRR